MKEGDIIFLFEVLASVHVDQFPEPEGQDACGTHHITLRTSADVNLVPARGESQATWVDDDAATVMMRMLDHKARVTKKRCSVGMWRSGGDADPAQALKGIVDEVFRRTEIRGVGRRAKSEAKSPSRCFSRIEVGPSRNPTRFG